MKHVGFILKVKESMIEDYKKVHANVWPEMLEALSNSGWHNYSRFMKQDGTLFGYFETPDSLQTAVEKMSQKEVNAKWQTMMSPYFEFPEGRRADEMLIELEEVFHTD
jgi:L-rhamnose mutarotase